MWLGVIIHILPLLVTMGHSDKMHCFAEDDQPHLKFATRTDPREVSNWEGSYEVPGCEPARLWMVARPGVSWPAPPVAQRLNNLDTLKEKILANRRQGRCQLCIKDIKSLEKTPFPYNIEPDKLGIQGINDLEHLGETIRRMFLPIFDVPYNSDEYEIQYTKHSNARQSAEAFARGLFGERFDIAEMPQPSEEDPLLDFLGHCKPWQSKVLGACAKERGDLDRSGDMQRLRASVSKRLGFKKPLSLVDITTMYMGCSLQKAMNPTVSPAWCAVFNASELKLLEYREDLMFYRACGPGDDSRVVRRLSCPLVNDLLHKFQQDQPRATIYVADEKVLLILLYGLGLLEGVDQGGYHTAELAPFAANLVAVMYKCPRQGDRVGLYLNGRPVDGGPQPWGLVLRRLGSFYRDSSECRVDVCGGAGGWRRPRATRGRARVLTRLAAAMAGVPPIV